MCSNAGFGSDRTCLAAAPWASRTSAGRPLTRRETITSAREHLYGYPGRQELLGNYYGKARVGYGSMTPASTSSEPAPYPSDKRDCPNPRLRTE
jgi:hypothetical protein